MAKLKITNTNISIDDQKFINAEKNKIVGSLVNFDQKFVTLNDDILGTDLPENCGLIINRGSFPKSSLVWVEHDTEFKISEDNAVFHKIWHQGNLIGTKDRMVRWERDDLLSSSSIREDAEEYIAIHGDIDKNYRVKIYGSLKITEKIEIDTTAKITGDTEILGKLNVEQTTRTKDLFVRNSIVFDLQEGDKDIQGFSIRRFQGSEVKFGWDNIKQKWFVTEVPGSAYKVWHDNDFRFLPKVGVLPIWDQDEKSLVLSAIQDDGRCVSIHGKGQEGFNFKVYGKSAFTSPITSQVEQGHAPFELVSKTLNVNLNADMVDGMHAAEFAKTNGDKTVDFSGKNVRVEENLSVYGNLRLVDGNGQVRQCYIDSNGFVKVLS